ncbi:MAG: DUF4145 domain-containing protein [Nitrososphaerales archaeon]
MSTDVISVRVNRKIKEDAVRLGVDVRLVVESAIENAVSQQKQRKVREAIDEIKRDMKGVTEEEWAQRIKKSRMRRATSRT